MKTPAATKQALQSIAGALPCPAPQIGHRALAQSAACALCGHPAETQSHMRRHWTQARRPSHVRQRDALGMNMPKTGQSHTQCHWTQARLAPALEEAPLAPRIAGIQGIHQ